jgi:two-component system nitrate/nitrite response regulator NarL
LAVNIVLHEASRLLADSLGHELRSVGHVVRVAEGQDDLARLLAEEPPDLVIVTDLLARSPSRQLIADTAAGMGIPVLVVASSDDAETPRRRSGAAGAVPRVVTLGSLLGALDSVAKKQPLVSFGPDGSVRRASTNALTPREQQVLSLLAEGASTRHIADQLGVSESSARTYVQRVLQRLGAHSRIEALSRVSTQQHETAAWRRLL